MKYSHVFAISLLICLPLTATQKKKPGLSQRVRIFEGQSSREAIENVNTHLEQEDDELTQLHNNARMPSTNLDPLVSMHHRGNFHSIAYYLLPIVNQMSGL